MKGFFATFAMAALAAAVPANAFVSSANRPVKTLPLQQTFKVSHHPFSKTNQVTRSSTSTTALAGVGTDLLADGSMSQSLIKLLLETLIVNGVPALFTVLVIGFAAWQFRPSKNDMDEEYGRMTDPLTNRKKNPAAELYSDLYGDDEDETNAKPMSPFRFLKLFKPQPTPGATNRGIPAVQYISITNLNQKYASYDYSLTAATQSKAKAAAAYRAQNFDRALRLAVNSNNGADGDEITLSPFAKTTLLELEQDFLKDGSKLLNAIQAAQVELTKNGIEEEMEAMGVELYELDPHTSATDVSSTEDNATIIVTTSEVVAKKDSKKDHKTKPKRSTEVLFANLLKAQKDLMKVELDFVKDVVATLGTERASGVRTALLGDIAARGAGGLLTQLQDRPLSLLLQGRSDETTTTTTTKTPHEAKGNNHRRKSLFVTNFPGDVMASQVAELREEVTAIVRNAKPGDEAMVILQTGGGTVTGYGLAAAQLLRFKEAGMKLTVAVEQVAASGGYMMCCVADKIVSSPFAVLGSIGVISDIPNVYERLKKEGVEFQTITAGKYKRTITPTKKVTQEDFRKTQEEIEQILVLFKQFVHQNRPSLDIEKVATGETWFGEDAKERGLTDEIKTADEVLTEYVDNGWDVYEVEYKQPDEPAFAFGGLPGGSNSRGLIGNAARWLIRTLVQEVKAELGSSSLGLDQRVSPEKRYMMVDDSAERYRAEDK